MACPAKGAAVAVAILAVLVSACEPEPAADGAATAATEPSTAIPRDLTVLTHDSFSISEDLLAAFEADHGIDVRFLEGGDTGTLVNRAVLSKERPVADVLYGVDNTFLSRAVDEGIFEAYESPMLAAIPSRFQQDPTHGALPVDFGDVCPNYDKAYFAEAGVAPPATLEDLRRPGYRGLLVVENPATSSPGLAFLLATIGRYGADGYLDYWRDLVANEVRVVNDWETAYNSEFSRAGGERPIVVSYASSPAFEVLYADETLDEAPTAAVTADSSCFRQIEFVGILQGTTRRGPAEEWVDFMLSQSFQEDIPLQMFVFPVNPQAALADAFTSYLVVPEETSQVSPADIAAHREEWIAAWTEAVLR